MISPILSILLQIVLVCGNSNEAAQFFPSNLRAKVLNSSSVRLTWDAANMTRRNVPKYKITVLKDFITLHTNPKIVTTTFTEDTTIDISNLSPSTLYKFKVQSMTKNSGPYEQGVDIEVKTWDEAGCNPSNLTVQILDESKIRLNWNAVKKCGAIPPSYTIKSEPYVAHIPTIKETSYVVANLNPSTTYKFKVYALNYVGEYYEPGVETHVRTSNKAGYIPSKLIAEVPTSSRLTKNEPVVYKQMQAGTKDTDKSSPLNCHFWLELIAIMCSFIMHV